MKTFIVPTDFSECSTNALNYAIELAKAQNAKIIIMHAVEMPLVFTEAIGNEHQDTEATAFIIEMTKKKFKALLTSYENENIESVIQFSSLVEGIKEVAKKSNADAVIMGTIGTSNFSKRVFGTNTSKVIRNMEIPVLAIPQGATYKPWKHVVIASDFAPIEHNAYENALEMARTSSPEISLLRVVTQGHFEGSSDIIRKMKAFSKKNQINNPSFIPFTSNTLINGLIEYDQMDAYDLVLIGTHGKNGFRQLFDPSVAEIVSDQIQKPILTFYIK